MKIRPEVKQAIVNLVHVDLNASRRIIHTLAAGSSTIRLGLSDTDWKASGALEQAGLKPFFTNNRGVAFYKLRS